MGGRSTGTDRRGGLFGGSWGTGDIRLLGLVAVLLAGSALFLLVTALPAALGDAERTAGEPRGIRVGAPAPDFALEALDGGTVRLSALRGRPVWLNFWATWCTPCKAEIPAMLEVAEASGSGGARLVAVNMGERRADVERYLSANGFGELPAVLDGDGAVSASYGVTGLPTHVFVDARGVVRRIEMRQLDAAEMRSALAELRQGRGSVRTR